MQPVTIRRGSFEAQLYDVGGFMALPLANVRKLWKFMLEDALENAEAVGTVREWLPSNVSDTEIAAGKEQERLQQVVQYTIALHSKIAAFGSMVTKEQKAELKEAFAVLRYAQKQAKNAQAQHDRAKKLQTIFTEMAKN